MIPNDNSKIALTLYNLYEKYLDLHPRDSYVARCIQSDLKSLKEQNKNLIDKLNVTLPVEKIVEIFKEFGVIQLRDIKTSTKLLLGCGNHPIDPSYANSNAHDHPEFVTINPQLTMNPTIIGAFGVDEGLNHLLPKHYYEALYGEAVTLAMNSKEFNEDKVKKTALECLQINFKTFEMGKSEPMEFDKSWLFYESDTETY